VVNSHTNMFSTTPMLNKSSPFHRLHGTGMWILRSSKRTAKVRVKIFVVECYLSLSIGYIKSYIVLPSTIYGLATGKLVDMGVQNRHSVQIPFLINASLARGQAGIVGEGKNVWPNVNIDESESWLQSRHLNPIDWTD
jgi:hypothetical protein